VQGLALTIAQVVSLVEDKIENSPVGQRRGLVQNETSILDARLQSLHDPTLRTCRVCRKQRQVPMRL